jgi:hypothetical protein
MGNPRAFVMACISVVPLSPIVLKFGNSEKHVTNKECRVTAGLKEKIIFEISLVQVCPICDLQSFMRWLTHVFIFIKFYCPFRTQQQTLLCNIEKVLPVTDLCANSIPPYV